MNENVEYIVYETKYRPFFYVEFIMSVNEHPRTLSVYYDNRLATVEIPDGKQIAHISMAFSKKGARRRVCRWCRKHTSKEVES